LQRTAKKVLTVCLSQGGNPKSALCLKPVINGIAIEQIGSGAPPELVILIEKCEEIFPIGVPPFRID
jgi:hypothetical protein